MSNELGVGSISFRVCLAARKIILGGRANTRDYDTFKPVKLEFDLGLLFVKKKEKNKNRRFRIDGKTVTNAKTGT